MNARELVKEELLTRLDDLSDTRLQEVLDFVEFLRTKEKDSDDPILSVAGCLSGKPLSAEEIEKELYGEERS